MSKELWDKGLAVRKEVLGAEYVERQLKTVDDFGMPMQELVTQSCWGWLWARPQLPRKMRSLVNLGVLSALNRPNEFKTHVRGALTNGCSREEIREVLLQVAVYCGMPAGVARPRPPHRAGKNTRFPSACRAGDALRRGTFPRAPWKNTPRSAPGAFPVRRGRSRS